MQSKRKKNIPRNKQLKYARLYEKMIQSEEKAFNYELVTIKRLTRCPECGTKIKYIYDLMSTQAIIWHMKRGIAKRGYFLQYKCPKCHRLYTMDEIDRMFEGPYQHNTKYERETADDRAEKEHWYIHVETRIGEDKKHALVTKFFPEINEKKEIG